MRRTLLNKSGPLLGGHSSAAAELPTPGSALIIGNRHQEARYAHRDATAFERFVLDVRRFNPDRILLLRDATAADITNALQSEAHQEGSEVLVYFSGHTVRGPGGERGLIDLLFANVAKLNARAVQIFLETSSAGTNDQGLRQRFPRVEGNKLTVFVATSPKEIALADEKARQGLFTRHLLDALYGWADDNGDGKVTATEAKAYLDDTMTPYARRELGGDQTASFIGARDTVLSAERADPAFDPPPDPAAASQERIAVSQVPASTPGGGRGGAVAQPRRASTHSARPCRSAVRRWPAGRHFRTAHTRRHRPMASSACGTANRVS